MVVDQVDTPWAVALNLARSVGQVPADAIVFDPTVGTGVLIAALEQVAGHGVAGAGTDLDPRRVGALRAARPTWTVGRADSTSERSIGRSPVWRAMRCGLDLVMLNPPFSFRGGAGVVVDVAGRRQVVSPAAAVVLQVLRELTPRLGMVGVLPVGFFVNTRDAPVRALLDERYEVEQLPLSRRTFTGVVASTLAVRITPKSPNRVSGAHSPAVFTPQVEWSGCRCVVVRRGTLQLHNLPSGLDRDDVVHTTDLSTLDVGSNRVRLDPRAVSGHLVLMPRVGKPDSEKIVATSGSFILSDCVIAISTDSQTVSERLGELLRETEAAYGDLYAGTGAPHMTIGRLVAHLRQLGLIVRDFTDACSCGNNLRRTA